MEIIDAEGVEFTLNAKYVTALLRCKLVSGMYDDPLFKRGAEEEPKKVLPMSGDKPFATAQQICLLAKYIYDIKSTQTKEKEHDFCTLLDLANYIEAPEHILYAFSNKAWPLLQEERSDIDGIKSYKKHLRSIAQNYLASPKYLARFIEQRKSTIEVGLKEICDTTKVNLSYEHVLRFFAEIKKANIEPWYEEGDGIFYDVSYRFVSLNGLKELRDALPTAKSDWPYDKILSLYLNSHAINDRKLLHAIFEVFPQINYIFLENNQIAEFDFPRFTQERLQNFDGDPTVSLIRMSNNKITHLNESFFEGIRQMRSYRRYMHFNLEGNPISPDQKTLMHKKMYYATHTFPERYVSLKNIKFLINPTLKEWGSVVLAGVPVGMWLFSALRQKHWPLCAVLEVGGLVGAAMGGATPGFACLSALLLAKMTHPELHISPHFHDTIWAKWKPKLSL